MNFFKQLELLVEKLVHPEAKAALAGIAAQLTAAKPTLVAEFNTSGQTVAVFIESKAKTLIESNPVTSPFSAFIMPLLPPFINKEIGYGATDVGEGIDKLATWLVAEEAVV